MSLPMVSIDGLTKSYGRLTAVADVSLSIHQGEVLGLIGPNGSGKTTLFECVAGVLPYEAGTISMKGRTLSQRDRASHIFYLPDAIAPWPAQTVGWALDFATGFFGRGNVGRDDVVERLDLGPLLNSPMGTLSKGQRKRRAVLAVGMLAPQPVVLAYEPFGGLGLRQTREGGAALRLHAAAGRTLFLSIHQIGDAARVWDRFVLLSAGRVRGEVTVRELAERVPSHPSNLEDIFLALT